MIREHEVSRVSGWLALGILIPALLAGIAALITSVVFFDDRRELAWSIARLVSSVLWSGLCVFLLAGLFTVNPNEGKVLQIFGKYVGTLRTAGIAWANPLYKKRRVSLRIRNFETNKTKVNDRDGNPIELTTYEVDLVRARVNRI